MGRLPATSTDWTFIFSSPDKRKNKCAITINCRLRDWTEWAGDHTSRSCAGQLRAQAPLGRKPHSTTCLLSSGKLLSLSESLVPHLPAEQGWLWNTPPRVVVRGKSDHSCSAHHISWEVMTDWWTLVTVYNLLLLLAKNHRNRKKETIKE